MKYLITPQTFVRMIPATTILAVLFSPLAAVAADGSVPVSVSVLPGDLFMQPSSSASLSSAVANHRNSSESTGQLGAMSVDDSRSNGAGWTLTASFSTLTSYGTFVDDSGQAGPFTVTGSYTGTENLDLTLDTGPAYGGTGLGGMTYALTDQHGNHYTDGSAAVLEATQAIGSTGLTLSAPDISFRPDTSYHLKIRAIAPSNFRLEPTAVLTQAGSSNGVTAGPSCQPIDSTTPCTVATASVGNGDGLYSLAAALHLTIPAGAASGTYYGQIVETIQ